MKVTAFEGVVEHGAIRLPAGVSLPDKTKVYIVVPDVEMQTVAYISSPRLAHSEQIADFKKEVVVESHDAGL
jgi:hypothetical protein